MVNKFIPIKWQNQTMFCNSLFPSCLTRKNNQYVGCYDYSINILLFGDHLVKINSKVFAKAVKKYYAKLLIQGTSIMSYQLSLTWHKFTYFSCEPWISAFVPDWSLWKVFLFLVWLESFWENFCSILPTLTTRQHDA